MANWSDLKAAVASIVKTNGNKEITGQLLQNVLNNIISNVGLNSSFAGIATPETNPGTPDGNVFYLATTAGTYSNFNGIVIEAGESVILEWKGSWVKKDSGFATKEKLLELEENTNQKLSELDEETDKKIKDLPSVGHSSFDLEIADESGVMLVGFRDGHIETKNFKSAEVEQQYESIKENVNKRIESIESELVDFAEADNSTTESDLDITDEDGNIIARYHDGVHETKYPSPFTKDDNLADFEITDKENNVIFRIKDGVPQTKKFDGGKISANVVAQVSSSIGRGQMRTSYSLIASNEKIELLDFPRYLDTRKFFSFIGYMSNFPSDAHFDFGIRYKYNGQYWHNGAWMRITPDKVELYQDLNENQSTLMASYSHSLTFSTFVKVLFYLREDYSWYIIIETLKGKYVIDYEGGVDKEIVGHPYFLNNGIVFNNAQITAGSADFKSPIWIFGDSYSTASYGYTRLGQQLMDLGISQNTCYNHLGGNNHGNAWDDLKLMLKFGTPRMIVWLLGVNGSQPQNVQITNELKELCDNMGIELVFQYPPLYPNSVGIDTTNLRNAVLATGCRIVNTSRAVGCDNSSGDAVWYDGYLDGDRIHPTELASRAIVMQLINDVPELIQWGLNEKPIYYSSNNN